MTDRNDYFEYHESREELGMSTRKTKGMSRRMEELTEARYYHDEGFREGHKAGYEKGGQEK